MGFEEIHDQWERLIQVVLMSERRAAVQYQWPGAGFIALLLTFLALLALARLAIGSAVIAGLMVLELLRLLLHGAAVRFRPGLGNPRRAGLVIAFTVSGRRGEAGVIPFSGWHDGVFGSGN